MQRHVQRRPATGAERATSSRAGGGGSESTQPHGPARTRAGPPGVDTKGTGTRRHAVVGIHKTQPTHNAGRASMVFQRDGGGPTRVLCWGRAAYLSIWAAIRSAASCTVEIFSAPSSSSWMSNCAAGQRSGACCWMAGREARLAPSALGHGTRASREHPQLPTPLCNLQGSRDTAGV